MTGKKGCSGGYRSGAGRKKGTESVTVHITEEMRAQLDHLRVSRLVSDEALFVAALDLYYRQSLIYRNPRKDGPQQ